MKVQTLVLMCDHAGCDAEFVSGTPDEVLTHVRATKAGWSIVSLPGYRRCHYCPEHAK